MRFTHRPPTKERSLVNKSPLQFGYILTLGVLGALATALTVYNLRSIVFSIFLALFVAVGLDPLVRWFQRRNLSRPTSIVIVIMLVTVLIVSIFWLIIPVFVQQMQIFATILTQDFSTLHEKTWFSSINTFTNGGLENVFAWVSEQLRNPQLWGILGTGMLGLGATVLNGIATGFFISILSIYFIATYDATKAGTYRLIARSKRDVFVSYCERMLQNFGKYLNGMAILAFFNASYSTLLLVSVGFPNPLFVGVIAFFVTLIPLIGTILTTIFITFLMLLGNPTKALIVFLLMLLYMQIEAYVLTPRIMRRAVHVPATVVLISALAGSTLFGLLGALVAIPFSAGILMIITEIVMPEKEKR